MCGLAGSVGAVDPDEVARVAAVLRGLAHRGPDGAGLVALRGAVLGHRRLALHDLSPAGAQPFVDDARGLAWAVNGTFHDAPSLRRELEADGVRFRGRSDCEILGPLVARRGAAAFDALRGPFAAALFDERRAVLTLARDRFGERPLFWTLADGVLRFASEPGALARAVGAARRRDVLPAFFRTGYVGSPASPFEGIHALPPATTLTWRIGDAAPTLVRRWTPPFPTTPSPTPDAAHAAFAAAFAEATAARLVADRQVGVLLSGGVDSSALVVAARRAGARPTAYVGAFEDPRFDESPAAVALAAKADLPVRVVRCDVGVAERLRGLVRTGDLLADSSTLALAAVCEAAKDETPILLAGDGGDELFLGYDRHRAIAFGRAGLRLAALLARLPGIRGARVAKAAAAAGLPPRRAYAELTALTPSPALAAWLAPEALGADPLVAAYEAEPPLDDLLADCGRLDVLAYLPEELLVKADRAAMLAGTELRAPFLDPAVADVALRLPGSVRADRRRGKLPLRAYLAAAGHDAPARARKRGFGVPLAAWLLTGPLAPLAREVLNDVREPFRGVLKDGSAAPLLDALRRGEPVAPLVYACLVAALHAVEFG